MMTDIQHNRMLEEHDAQVCAWERVWDEIRTDLHARLIILGYDTPDSVDLIEAVAGDLTDLYLKEATGEIE